MSHSAATPETAAVPALTEPRHPTLWALLATVVPVAALAWPMLLGRWLVGVMSDQASTGYAWRDWSAHAWRAGHFPVWDGFEFGGIPWVGGQHGDLFYWTSFLRLVLPADTVMNIGFAAHYVIAGLLAYALLRSLRISWLGSVVGALGYELAGLVISYPAPGHDGKLFVTALLPGALLCINLAVRQRRRWAYAGLALAVGLALLSPHFQMTYYLLVASGLFTLYAAFGKGDGAPSGLERWAAVGFALAAVVVGFGLAGVEIVPFLHYLPYSPRATGYSPGSGSGSFEASTSYAIPWSHLPEFFIAGFTGTTFQDSYWASNPLKLHSEYLGLPILVLAGFGVVSRERRRLIWWIGGIGLLFLLVAMGSDTPFYRLWWLMPYVKQTRAPGMAIYVTTLTLAALAGIGVDRLLTRPAEEQGQAKLTLFEKTCLIGGGVIALLGLTGVLGAMASSMAQAIGEAFARQQGADVLSAAQYYMDLASRDAETIRWSGVIGGLALAAVGALFLARRAGRLPAALFMVLLPAVIGADLWRNGRTFWDYQAPAREGLYRTDPIIDYLKRQPLPYRVLELSNTQFQVYGGAMLMDFGIPQVLGQHSFQINTYNMLMGGKNEWRYLLSSRRIWDVNGVEFVLLPEGADPAAQLPAFKDLTTDFDTAMTAMTSTGKRAVLFKRKTPVPWARIVPGAATAPDDQAAILIADPRQPEFFDQLVLLPPNSPIKPPPLRALPAPLTSRVVVRSWAAGRMSLAIEPAATQDAYVVISDNWYRDWRATVDGTPVTPVRGDVTYLVVPVHAGANSIELHVQADDVGVGRNVSLASLGLIALGFIVPGLWRRKPRG